MQHVLFVFLLLEIYKGYCERCKSAFYLLIKILMAAILNSATQYQGGNLQ